MKKMYFLLCLLLGLNAAVHAQNGERRTTVWNGSEWSNGTPDAYGDAIVAADLTATDELQAYNLTIIANARLTMSAPSRLVLFNNGIVEPGAKITIEENAQFIQKNMNALTPSMDFTRKTAFILKYDYTFFCSPVSGQVINNIVDTDYYGGNLNAGYNNSSNGGTYLPPRPDKYLNWNQSGAPVGTDSNLYSAGAWQYIPETSVMDNTGRGSRSRPGFIS